MEIKNLILESEHLRQMPISHKYKENIFKEFTSEITTYMFPQAAKDISETEWFINDSIEKINKNETIEMVMLDKDTNEFLGCGWLHDIKTKTPELWIRIKKFAHWHWYGKEAMFALKNRADENIDYEYILYPVERENYPSRRIPEALWAKVFREYKKNNMAWKEQDILEYRIYKI